MNPDLGWTGELAQIRCQAEVLLALPCLHLSLALPALLFPWRLLSESHAAPIKVKTSNVKLSKMALKSVNSFFPSLLSLHQEFLHKKLSSCSLYYR